ncbi:putative TBC1 domain family member 2A [Apostichopus japonicus]|uniref:Putative TBC1 domain family member 2A n=1 Tax=Stichopus japonicus TaxID=307972 RepID=A0A2G8L1M7_STIJA|nr:putative TBC1 domain family member 2A [Apostichopus japonicus]
MGIYWRGQVGVGHSQHGYKIEFSSSPPFGGGGRQTLTPTDPVKRLALEGEILALLAKQAITRVPEETGPLFRSSFFLTKKRDGTWRPILNLKPLNTKHIRPKHFRMETLNLILPLLRKGMWAATVDLRDAYLHILIHKEHRRFLAFRYAEQDYQFRALPFGLATAPRTFTRVAGAVVAYLRKRGVTLYVYLDDWLVVGNSLSEATNNVHKTLQTLQELGWIVNQKKSRLSPSQTIQFLGAILDFTTGVARPSEERVAAVKATTQQILAHRGSPTGTWLRALGLMASLVDIVRLCRLHMRPLQLHLLRSADPTDPDKTTLIYRSEEVTQHFRWWLDPNNWSSGVPFAIQLPMTSITTDASLSGWGAHWSNRTAWGTWSQTETSLHINILEMMAVKRALEAFNDHVQGTITTIFTDNTTVVAYINRQGAPAQRDCADSRGR